MDQKPKPRDKKNGKGKSLVLVLGAGFVVTMFVVALSFWNSANEGECWTNYPFSPLLSYLTFNSSGEDVINCKGFIRTIVHCQQLSFRRRKL